MLRTVKDVSELSGVTVKTLHHYHKIGLLLPREIREPSGYRYYGTPELERLQQILFYRELDVPLTQIKRLLDGNPERSAVLAEQYALLLARRERLARIIRTLEDTVEHEKRGDSMDQDQLFTGFGSEAEWREALKAQNAHLQETYGFDLAEAGGPDAAIDVAAMNEQATEAARFMGRMAEALRAGTRHDAADVQAEIGRHLAFLRQRGHAADAASFAAQCRFFLGDDFHRAMLESQQIGLAYYLCAAADAGADAAAADRG